MKVVLVGNKCDLTDNSYNKVLESEPIERQVSYDEGLKFASKYEFTFFETSAKLGISVDAAFQTLATNWLLEIIEPEKKKLPPLKKSKPKGWSIF